MLKSELLGSSVGEKPPSELERGDEAAFSDRIGGERGIDRERRTKVLHPSRGWEYPDRVGMAKTEIPVYGFVVFLIFYLLGAMGGGDIKLMAALGTIVGDEKIWLAAILTGMLGALMALLYLAGRKAWEWLRPAPQKDTSVPARKAYIPYAPAISLGMLLTFLTEDGLWTNV